MKPILANFLAALSAVDHDLLVSMFQSYMHVDLLLVADLSANRAFSHQFTVVISFVLRKPFFQNDSLAMLAFHRRFLRFMISHVFGEKHQRHFSRTFLAVNQHLVLVQSKMLGIYFLGYFLAAFFAFRPESVVVRLEMASQALFTHRFSADRTLGHGSIFLVPGRRQKWNNVISRLKLDPSKNKALNATESVTCN